MKITKETIELFPFRLRDHLVPFLFNEFKSEESVVMPDITSKAIKLNKKSSLCRIISLVHSRYENHTESYDYKIQFSIKQVRGGIQYESSLYKIRKQVFERMSFSASDNKIINGFFEDIFRTAFLYYVNGSKKYTIDNIKLAINDFIDHYDLLELGFDSESLRALYYRENGDTEKLSRFQYQMTNRVNNYEHAETMLHKE